MRDPVRQESSRLPCRPPPLPRGLRRVAVLRALMLGDLLCATPALRALRAAQPAARIALVGLPWGARSGRAAGQRRRVRRTAGLAGARRRSRRRRAPQRDFVDAMRARRLDLAVQLHGSGGIVNPLVVSWGARLNAGFAVPGAPRPARRRVAFRRLAERGTEVERLLALTDALGKLPRRGERLDFPLREADRRAAADLLAAAGGGGDARLVVVHAGSQLPSRRWAPERFAAVADALAGRGLRVALTGTDGERPLVAAVRQAMRAPALDLVGRTDLWTLGAVVERASLVVCSDTGLSHVAAALGTPSVVVASGSDVARWAPADARRHRVLWHPVPCRPCAHPVCPTARECAAGVDVAYVRSAALAALESA
ncbi:MAG: glycosyltransferase family 9 protein [Comamonadaceae bacterium]|nr:glycosyltransferase family 9 protein [Comamonadaceae bacterium]